MNFKIAPEYKCKNCNRGELKHNANTKACPLSSGQWPSFHATQKFESNGKLTIQSKRAIAKQEEYEARIKAQEEDFKKEKSIVRHMTFEELVTATVEMLTRKTGLGIIVERVRDNSAEIHLTTLGGVIRLGYTSVTQYSNGRYGVAGTSAGCFMANGSDNDISNVLRDDFRELENHANAPKKVTA